jgi:hypothetical protein
MCFCVSLPAGPNKQHPLIKIDAAGQPHQHVDLLSPKTHANRQRKQQQPQQQQQQQQPQQQQQQKDSGSSQGAAIQQASAAAAVEFGEASDVQLEEMEALEVSCSL